MAAPTSPLQRLLTLAMLQHTAHFISWRSIAHTACMTACIAVPTACSQPTTLNHGLAASFACPIQHQATRLCSYSLPTLLMLQLGLDPSNVQILGRLGPFLSVHYLSVAPVLGRVPPQRELHAPTPSPDEVAAVSVDADAARML